MTNEERDALLAAARGARKNAYAPYSHFTVGAALLAENGEIFCGCNVENAAYSPTLCAERVALGSAVAHGARRILAVAVVGGHGEEEPCAPCGVCRQALAELAAPDASVLFRTEDGIAELPLSKLLPYTFRLKK